VQQEICNKLMNVFIKYDFQQKCAGNTPESNILHLKFQKKIPAVIPQASLAGEGDLLLHPSPPTAYAPDHV